MKKNIFIFLPIFILIGAIYSIVFKFQNMYELLFFLSDIVLIFTGLGIYLYCIKDINIGLVILFISLLSFWALGALKLFFPNLVIIMSLVIFYSIYMKLCYIRYEKMKHKTYEGSKLEFIDNNRYRIYAIIISIYIIFNILVQGIVYGFHTSYIIKEIPFLLLMGYIYIDSYKYSKSAIILLFTTVFLSWYLWYSGFLYLSTPLIITALTLYAYQNQKAKEKD